MNRVLVSDHDGCPSKREHGLSMAFIYLSSFLSQELVESKTSSCSSVAARPTTPAPSGTRKDEDRGLTLSLHGHRAVELHPDTFL